MNILDISNDSWASVSFRQDEDTMRLCQWFQWLSSVAAYGLFKIQHRSCSGSQSHPANPGSMAKWCVHLLSSQSKITLPTQTSMATDVPQCAKEVFSISRLSRRFNIDRAITSAVRR